MRLVNEMWHYCATPKLSPSTCGLFSPFLPHALLSQVCEKSVRGGKRQLISSNVPNFQHSLCALSRISLRHPSSHSFTYFALWLTDPTRSHPIPSHPTLSHPILSHPIPPYPIHPVPWYTISENSGVRSRKFKRHVVFSKRKNALRLLCLLIPSIIASPPLIESWLWIKAAVKFAPPTHS